MAITIRHADPADYGPIIAVVDSWWGGRPMADTLPRLFFVHFRPTSFVAGAEGRVVGFLAGFRSQTHSAQAYIHFVGVDPAWRGSGVGRALYERFFDAARELGCSEVHGVTSPINRTSIRFHASMGFDVLHGDAEPDGIPYVTDYDGPGSASGCEKDSDRRAARGLVERDPAGPGLLSLHWGSRESFQGEAKGMGPARALALCVTQSARRRGCASVGLIRRWSSGGGELTSASSWLGCPRWTGATRPL